MGYCVTATIDNLRLWDSPDAVLALNNLDSAHGWIDEDKLPAHTLAVGLEAWRYGCSQDNDLVKVNWFTGEKLSELDEGLWVALAPFVYRNVKEAPKITWTGEDGDQWRYVFEDGVMHQEEGVTIWKR